MDTETGPTTKRLEALTDGVYAIAMTLLVLNLDIPLIRESLSSMALYKNLLNEWPTFLHYVLSFILLGTFWVVHHVQFHHIKGVNRTLIWINILNLMFVAVIPFSTSYMSDYGDFMIAAVIFHLNLFFIGFFFYLNWAYATHNHRFVEHDLDEKQIIYVKKRNLVVPVFSLVAIALSFFIPRWSTLPYIFIPFILADREKLRIFKKAK